MYIQCNICGRDIKLQKKSVVVVILLVTLHFVGLWSLNNFWIIFVKVSLKELIGVLLLIMSKVANFFNWPLDKFHNFAVLHVQLTWYALTKRLYHATLPINWNELVGSVSTEPNYIVLYRKLGNQDVVSKWSRHLVWFSRSFSLSIVSDEIPLSMFSYVLHRWPEGTAELFLMYRCLIQIEFCSMQQLAPGEAFCSLGQLLTSPEITPPLSFPILSLLICVNNV